MTPQHGPAKVTAKVSTESLTGHSMVWFPWQLAPKGISALYIRTAVLLPRLQSLHMTGLCTMCGQKEWINGRICRSSKGHACGRAVLGQRTLIANCPFGCELFYSGLQHFLHGWDSTKISGFLWAQSVCHRVLSCVLGCTGIRRIPLAVTWASIDFTTNVLLVCYCVQIWLCSQSGIQFGPVPVGLSGDTQETTHYSVSGEMLWLPHCIVSYASPCVYISVGGILYELAWGICTCVCLCVCN